MTEFNESTPLPRSATSPTTLNANTSSTLPPSRRKTHTPSKSFFSNVLSGARDTVLSAYKDIFPPAPTDEELNEALSSWAEIGEGEVRAYLVRSSCPHSGHI